MKYIQIGELGKAVIVTNKAALPTAGILFLNKFYVTADTNYIYTCKQDGSGYSWKQVTILPALTNGLANSNQLLENVEAIDANGNKIIGTLKLVEKVINANGVYVPSEDNAQGYSKVTVNIAGESAENPYIATTEAEMNAYLAAEYADSFVKYKTPLYFNQVNTVPCYCKSRTELTGAIDMALGPAYVNAKIDKWLPEAGMIKIASIETFNHSQTFRGEAIPYSGREYFDIYAYKYKNTDGSYTRALLYGRMFFLAYEYEPSTSTTWYNADGGLVTLLYIDNLTQSVLDALQQLSITMTIDSKTYPLDWDAPPVSEFSDWFNPMGFAYYAVPNKGNYTDYWGKYESDDSDSAAGIYGVAQLSWATYNPVYWNSTSYPRCTYLYKDASVLLAGIQTSSSTQNYKMESEKTYRDGFVYTVNQTQKTRTIWQAESPLMEGDQLAGATYYFNQQITHKEYSDLCKQLIPDSQRVDDDSTAYFFYNVDNPQPEDSLSISNLVSMLPLIDVDDRHNILTSYAFFPANVPHTPINPVAIGDTIDMLHFATEITPDFTKFDWSQAAVDSYGQKILNLIEGTSTDVSNNDRLQVEMIPAGTDLEGYITVKDNYVITAGTGGEGVYVTEEYAQVLGVQGGWLQGSISMTSTTVTSVLQQDIWGKYISKDGRWDTGDGDESSVFLFTTEPTDTTTIAKESVTIPTSYTYADNITTVPATLGKVNMPLITNGVIGKTANFSKTTETYDVYYFTQQVVPGNVFIEGTKAKMDALLTEPALNNEVVVNRVYMYTGETTDKYIQGALYILTED